MIRVALVLLLFSLFSGCLQDLGMAPMQPSAQLTDAEYAVLAALVDSVIMSPADSTLILRDSTTPGLFQQPAELDSALTRMLLRVGQEVPGLKAETMQDFKAKNLFHTYILNPPKIHPGCIRSSSTTRFFPMLEVSRVGLSADGQQALAYVGHAPAPLAGYGACYVLSRQAGRWTIVGGLMMWIS
jgi:hypothetical protein